MDSTISCTVSFKKSKQIVSTSYFLGINYKEGITYFPKTKWRQKEC